MGHEVVYCVGCGTRLTARDFEKGSAVRVSGKVACAQCAPGVAASTPPEERAAPEKGTAAAPSPATRRALSTTKPAEGKNRTLVLALAGLGVAALGGLALVAVSRSGEGTGGRVPDPTPAPEARARDGRSPPPVGPAERAAWDALDKARRLSAANPGDLDAAIEAFEAALRRAEGTAYRGEAQEALQALQAARGRTFREEGSQLEGRAQPLLEKEEFKAALSLFEQARARRGSVEWTAPIDRRLQEIRKEARARYGPLKEKAAEARRKGAEEEARSIRKRVGGWGLADLVEDLDRHLASDPSAQPPSPESKEYRAAWEKALVRAASRDYEGILAELERAAKGIVDEGLRREAGTDAEEIRRVRGAHDEALRILSRWPKGEGLSLEATDESGERKGARGRAVRASPFRIELSGEGGETRFVEFADIAASSLAEVVRSRSEKAEGRTLAVFCLLEGDVEAARTLAGAPAGTIAEKYWAFAEAARARARTPRPPPPRELEARKLFYAAEREFGAVETFGPAILKYRTLLREYGETRLVTGEAKRIAERGDAGREYLLGPGDLRGSGSVRLRPHPEAGGCWSCQEDVTLPASARETYVEFAFTALPETVYLCWVYAGACCEETFAAHLQATEMTVADPQKKAVKVPCEPGAPVAASVDSRIKGLKKTHASHGGEKQPSRWEWIPIPLPAYAGPGLKKARILTDQKGFSVAFALVTSLRKAPPAKDELGAAIEQARAAAAEGSGAERRTPLPAKVVYAQNFEGGLSTWGGEIVDGGVGGSKALAFTAAGATCWSGFSTQIGPTTLIRMKLKPLVGVGKLNVFVSSKALADNGRYFVTGLKTGEWNEVEFKGSEVRTRYDRSGPSLEGGLMNNIKIFFEGVPEGRILLDDFEIRE